MLLLIKNYKKNYSISIDRGVKDIESYVWDQIINSKKFRSGIEIFRGVWNLENA